MTTTPATIKGREAAIADVIQRYREFVEWCDKELATGFKGFIWPYEDATSDAILIAKEFVRGKLSPAPSAPSAAVERELDLPDAPGFWIRNSESEIESWIIRSPGAGVFYGQKIDERGYQGHTADRLPSGHWQRLDASESERQRDIAQADAEKLRAAYESALETIDCLNERLTASQQERDRLREALIGLQQAMANEPSLAVLERADKAATDALSATKGATECKPAT